MLQAMCEDDPRLEVNDCEFYRTEKGYTYESMEKIQEKYPDAKLYFLAGGDKVSIISRRHRIREFLEQFQIVVVKRDGDDPENSAGESIPVPVSGPVSHHLCTGWHRGYQFHCRPRYAEKWCVRCGRNAPPQGLGNITGERRYDEMKIDHFRENMLSLATSGKPPSHTKA